MSYAILRPLVYTKTLYEFTPITTSIGLFSRPICTLKPSTILTPNYLTPVLTLLKGVGFSPHGRIVVATYIVLQYQQKFRHGGSSPLAASVLEVDCHPSSRTSHLGVMPASRKEVSPSNTLSWLTLHRVACVNGAPERPPKARYVREDMIKTWTAAIFPVR